MVKLVNLTFITAALMFSSSLALAADDADSDLADTDSFAQQEMDLMDIQQSVNSKWKKLHKDQRAKLMQRREATIQTYEKKYEDYKKSRQQMDKQWKQLSLKQQLAGILEAFQNQGGEIWAKDAKIPGNITLHVDTGKNQLRVQSDNLDAKGRPTYEWELERDTGHITKTSRSEDGSEVHVTEKEIDPESLSSDEIVQPTNLHSVDLDLDIKGDLGSTKDPLAIDDDLIMEQQKDLAFNVLKFMIGFIIVTFGLLYVFFKQTQEPEQQTKKINGKTVTLPQNSQTFIDFLSGRMDYEHILKTTANPDAAKPSQKGRRGNQAATYDQEELLTQKPNFSKKKVAEHRRDTGFGGNNLEHLATEERGRFDHIDVEGTKHSDFSLLANFSNL